MRKIISRAGTIAISVAAFTAFHAPAAEAAPNTRLTVCVYGTDGRGTDVEVNRAGPGGRFVRDADPCHTFYGLRPGVFLVDIDLPRGYRISDDDRWIRLSPGERERVTFYAQRERNRNDRDDRWDNNRGNDRWDNDRWGNDRWGNDNRGNPCRGDNPPNWCDNNNGGGQWGGN